MPAYRMTQQQFIGTVSYFILPLFGPSATLVPMATHPTPSTRRFLIRTLQRELRKAREAEVVRLRFQQQVGASPHTELVSPSCLPLALPEPELAREDAEDSLRRLLEENKRLKDENTGLASEVSSLRAQVEEISAAPATVAAAASTTTTTTFSGTHSRARADAMALVAPSNPGSPADGQRSATPSPEDEISGIVVSGRGEGPTGLGLDAVGVVAVTTDSEQGGQEDGKGRTAAAIDVPAPLGAENLEVLEMALVAPLSPSPRHGQGRLSPATATGRAQFWGADGACGDDAGSKSASSADGGGGGLHEQGDRGGEAEEMRHREKAEIQRVIEQEAERVYRELRANPPPEIKALLAAREEMDEVSAAARTTLRELKSSGVLPGGQQHQQSAPSPPPLDQDSGSDHPVDR